MFDPKMQNKANSMPRPSALKIKHQSQARQTNEEYAAMLKHLAECIEREGFNPGQFFRSADRNFNKVLTIDEIKEHIKVMLPNSFAGLNFKKLSNALDVSNSGILEESEFISIMRKAIQSGSETDKFQKITSALTGSPIKRVTHKRSEQSGSHTDKVKPEHRLTHVEAINYFKKLIGTAKKITNMEAVIKGIFDKILAWKAQMGDLDQQDKKVSQKLRPIEKIDIHNIKTVMLKMQQLMPEIKLSDDDVVIIAFTSIDQDFFTNMLISQNDFTEWFTTNYAGENTVEADLLRQALDKWEGIVVLSE